MTKLAELFSLHGEVSRRQYALVGFSLALLKYAVDAALFWTFLGKTWTPIDYLSPFLATKWQLGNRRLN